MSTFLDIDGSVLEGGGQILRMSIAFSAILGVPVRITKIRAGRAKPGLAAQHLKGIELVAEMCQAKVTGASMGSTEVTFSPGKIRGGNFEADTKTAGSISLLLQAALPCALFAPAPTTLTLRGGTNADLAPQVDYMTEVYRPVLARFGAGFDFDLLRRGYYPRGGGACRVVVRPVRRLAAVTATEPGRPRAVHGWSFVAGSLPVEMSHEAAAGARRALAGAAPRVDIDCYKETREMAPDNCCGIVLVCETSTGCTLGASALARRGRGGGAGGPGGAGDAGSAAGGALAAAIAAGVCLDEHAQDQVILPMALAHGRSRARVGALSLHTRTAVHVAALVAGVEFTVTASGDTNIIECCGRAVDNHAVDNHAVDNHAVDNHAVDNHAIDNHAVDNHAVDNHAVDNHAVGNHAVDNHAALHAAPHAGG